MTSDIIGVYVKFPTAKPSAYSCKHLAGTSVIAPFQPYLSSSLYVLTVII